MYNNLLLYLYKFAVATRMGCVRLKLYTGKMLPYYNTLQPAWVALDWNRENGVAKLEDYKLQSTRVVLDWNTVINSDDSVAVQLQPTQVALDWNACPIMLDTDFPELQPTRVALK